jgi:hypothetical protein
MNAVKQETAPRIQVMLNSIISNQPALKIATRIADSMNLMLEGVYVEDEDLLNVSELSFLREISASTLLQQSVDPQRMQQALAAQARQLERFMQQYAEQSGVHCSFRVWRGRATLASLSADLDAEIISISGMPAYRYPVLAKRQNAVADIYLLIGPDLPSSKMLDVIKRLSGSMALNMHVLLTAGASPDSMAGHESIRQLASGLTTQQIVEYTSVQDIAAILSRSDNPVLFLSADNPLLVDADFNQMLKSLSGTVFIIR